jgi:hypothetical protein
MTRSDCDVLVVGAGPVGQVTALLLAQHGLRGIVLERWRRPYSLPRAVGLADDVLRVLHTLGLGARLRAALKVLHFDLARAPVEEQLAALLSVADPSRLHYGSDFPFTPWQACQYLAQQLQTTRQLDDGALDAVFAGNAARLLCDAGTSTVPASGDDRQTHRAAHHRRCKSLQPGLIRGQMSTRPEPNMSQGLRAEVATAGSRRASRHPTPDDLLAVLAATTACGLTPKCFGVWRICGNHPSSQRHSASTLAQRRTSLPHVPRSLDAVTDCPSPVP